MLRITKVDESPSQITMKLEGKLASDWVPLLESECLRCLQEKREVLLDFSDLTFIDGRGVELLRRMATENIKVVGVTRSNFAFNSFFQSTEESHSRPPESTRVGLGKDRQGL